MPSEFCGDRSNVPLESVTGVYRRTRPRSEDELDATQLAHAFEQTGRHRQTPDRLLGFGRLSFAFVDGPRNGEHVAIEIRPLDSDCLTDPQTGYCKKQHQCGIGFLQPFHNCD